jgi:cytochrome c556
MIRTMLAVVTAGTIALGVCVAAAQEDPIKTRKDLMKANGDQAKQLSDMAKGEKPFDLAAVHKAFAQFEDAASKMPNLYPANTQSEAGSPAADDFTPTAKVWEDMADFKARFGKFGEDAKAANASVTDVESLKTVLGTMGKNDCGGCHQIYRAKKGA